MANNNLTKKQERTILLNLGYVLHSLGSSDKMLESMFQNAQNIHEFREDMFQKILEVLKTFYPEVKDEEFRKITEG